MASIKIHPSELAYAFSYAKTEQITGWGDKPFLPPADAEEQANWLIDGEERLARAGRLIGTSETGFNFAEEMSSIILTLVDPTVVLCAERKDGEGLRRLTVHLAQDNLVGLMQHTDDMFEVTRYANLTAAAAACAAFLGAGMAPVENHARIDTPHAGPADP
jgi:hypothetical protein